MAIIIPGSPSVTERSIRLDTALGNPIDNGQVFEISAFERNQFRLFERWAEKCKIRTEPTPRYNCHGMTFASRRTAVSDREAVNAILEDDGYVEICVQEVLPGDVIIYFAEDGDAEHSGVVTSSPRDNILGIPEVISKWGKYAEFVHWANQCPYDFSNAKYYRIKVKDEPAIAK